MTDVKAFIRKWNGRTLEDDGCYVSKEFHSFQVSFFNAMRKIAASLGGEVVNPCYGHYDMCGFVKRGDKYVFFNYDNSCGRGGRSHVALRNDGNWLTPMYCRTAKHDKDWTGGSNNNCYFEDCESVIERLLDS
jgi:hypothetical protein